MRTAFVFPGQGSQAVGMGRELLDRFPSKIRPFYERANRALGFDLNKLIFDGPENLLTLTQHAQPAILLDSVIKYELLKERLLADLGAGHSLGEFSALVCAGVLQLEDALMLVYKRGTYMQEAVPVGKGGMMAVLKLELGVVEDICKKTGSEIANFNSPGQVVISGTKEQMAAAKELAAADGGRCIELDVSAPFHSKLMAPAERRLESDIDQIKFSRPQFPVISTVSGQPEVEPGRLKDLLKKQITSQVRWVDYVLRIKALGVTRLVEVGPGEVLTRLNKRIDAGLAAQTFREAFDS